MISRMKRDFIRETGESANADLPVPGLARGLAVIEHLAARPRGCAQKELVQALHIPAAGAMRIVSQLEAAGYVTRAADRTYRLTGRLFGKLRTAFADADVIEAALPEMRRLAEETGETAVLGVLCEGGVTVLDSVPGGEPFHLAVDAGHRVALHASAPGKAMLAALPEDEREKLVATCPFDAHTARTVTSATALAAQLARARRTGWALDEQEDYEGVCCAAAPVRGRSGRAVAVVWTCGPAVRLRKTELRAVAVRVAEAARRISQALA